MKPTVYLLCGLPGSGKTVCAKNLEKSGMIRLTLDEELFKRFGRKYENHDQKQAQTKVELNELLVAKIKSGESVILDYGFWKKTDRDEYKVLIKSLGARWKLLYFKADLNVLAARLASRNITGVDTNHVIGSELLDQFATEFEAPSNEDEEVIEWCLPKPD